MTAPAALLPPPQAVLNQMITGSWISQAIFVVAELGVADLLEHEAHSPSQIAVAIGANPDGVYRIMRALASIGVFRENEAGRFENTQLSELLRTNSPGSMRAWARMAGSKWHWEHLAGMLTCTRTGQKAPVDLWAHFEQNKDDGDIFNQAMTSFSASEIGPILEAYDFTGIKTLMDVAGGYGSLLAAALEANRGMRGILFDAPPVIVNARQHIDATSVADRCELVAGDFFVSVPSGADAIMLKHILHDWQDDDSLRILRCCHSALPAGGKILVIDSVIRPGNDPDAGKILDIPMLLIGGRERTEEAFRALLDASGFELTRIVDTACPVSIVEGRKR